MCNMKGVAHSDYYTQTFISDISKHFSIFQQIVLVFKAWNLTVCYFFLSPLSLHCFQQWKQAALPAQQQAVDRQCYSMSKQQACQTCFSLKRLTQQIRSLSFESMLLSAPCRLTFQPCLMGVHVTCSALGLFNFFSTIRT